MIARLGMHNFKCWRSLSLPLGSVTLVTGLNGAGKSTVLQAISLLAQSMDQRVLTSGHLALNGEHARLGRAVDILSEDASGDDVGLDIEWDDGSSWSARFHVDGDRLVSPALTPPARPPFNGRVQLLSADRLGAEVAYPMSFFDVRERRLLGSRGQYTAHFLAEYGRNEITAKSLAHPRAASLGLTDQVEAWLGEVSPGVRIHVTPDHDLDQVKLQFSFEGRYGPSRPYRPTNVGFGLAYALPLLTAALAAGPGELVLVENPESHLHPRGQARLMELMARMSTAGVQVVVESHSDHVLNGLRLAVHSGHVSASHTRVHFFGREKDGHVVVSPTIDSKGRIDVWPDGFFDEWELSLGRLLEPAGRP